MEMNGGIDMESRILTEADCDPEWIGQYWDYEGRYQRFICWDENNNKPTYWDAEACQWEGEKHKIPTTGTWIEHPYKAHHRGRLAARPLQVRRSGRRAVRRLLGRGQRGRQALEPGRAAQETRRCFPGGVEVKLKDGSTISADTVWEAFSDSLEQYTLEYVSEVTEVPVDKIEEGVRIYTTRLNPLHGNGGIHYQLAPDQTGHAVQNTRALQLIACITGNSDEPAGNRGSSKAQVDGCCGRANMLVTDHEPKDWAWTWAPWSWATPQRDLSVEDQIPLIQNFVQYLIDEKSPLAERYGNKVPTAEEARWIAERKGGAYKPKPLVAGAQDVVRQQREADFRRALPAAALLEPMADSAAIWDSINGIDTPYQIHGGVCMSATS